MKLLISTDLGITYRPAEGIEPEQENDLGALKEIGAFLDKKMVRWVVVDGDEVKAYCRIHEATVEDMKRAREVTGEDVCMTTDDEFMAKLIEENGLAALSLTDMLEMMKQGERGFH